MSNGTNDRAYDGSEIAIIGMACRLPGADTPESFWQNLRHGVESLTELTDEELQAAGVDPATFRHPRHVRRVAVVDDVELFDAEFFGYTPLEARLMDPQHRLFLECAWEVFERAAYDPAKLDESVGVFTGAKTNSYLFSLFSNRELFDSLDTLQLALGNDLAAMATRVAFKFDLRGPAYALHTACSTSLVAVHLAMQSLLLDECRLAVAGGACVNVPQRTGYLYQEGGILSPDGSCRTFDAEAAGSNFGNGAGAVLLKRLDDAIEDGDTVYAILRGSAANNDGAAKASFTAPGVEGQTQVLMEAMATAGVEPRDVSYIEAHGTATGLGDSIEMLALTQAFRSRTEEVGYCSIGSVKTNLGHLETAAGIAGLIKTALALHHEELPPSLHFDTPNPGIDFATSPFQVQRELTPWPRDPQRPRLAGVSSFGIGSTNAHVIVEEAPKPAPQREPSRPQQLLVFSARSEEALDEMTSGLAAALDDGPPAGQEESPWLADVAYSLQVGRRRFAHRRSVVVGPVAEAAHALRQIAAGEDRGRGDQRHHDGEGPAVAFLFPGLGEHYPGMAAGLYRREATFRSAVDRCLGLLDAELRSSLEQVFQPPSSAGDAAGKPDLRAMLGRGDGARATSALDDTAIAQPAVFVVEYALAELWRSWGVEPAVVLGYSLGEYVAACIAGVLELESALGLVVRRARWIADLPAGRMLAVPLSESDLAPRCRSLGLSIASVNGPASCVVSGPSQAVQELADELDSRDIVHRPLPTTHAFHSEMMAPLVQPLRDFVAGLELRAPKIPLISNVTGRPLEAAEAQDAGYWGRHLVATVRFAESARTLLEREDLFLLEVGPGQGLISFLRQQPDLPAASKLPAAGSLRNVYAATDDVEVLLAAVGRLWAAGVEIDWEALHGGARRRVSLPTYPFQRRRHWVDLPGTGPASQRRDGAARRPPVLAKNEDLSRWFYRPRWRRRPLEDRDGLVVPGTAELGPWLLLMDPQRDGGLGEAMAAMLEAAGEQVTRALPGEGFERRGDGLYELAPEQPEAYQRLMEDLRARGSAPRRVVHLWGVTGDGEESVEAHLGDTPSPMLQRGFFSVLALVQALSRQTAGASRRLLVAQSAARAVAPGEPVRPERAAVLGLAKVIPQEFPELSSAAIDLPLTPVEGWKEGLEILAGSLVEEAALGPEGPDHRSVALRPDSDSWSRWVEDYEAVPVEAPGEEAVVLEPGGTYLVTGGLGGVGLVLARHLAESYRANLILTRRGPVPELTSEAAVEEPELTAEAAEAPELGRLRAVAAELEELGARVTLASADVADAPAMAAVVAAAVAEHGSLDGVLHAAGIGSGALVQMRTAADAAAVLAPKVVGTRVLEDVLEGLPPEQRPALVMLFSSFQSVVGDFGQADYCGANLFLDAFAEAREGREHPRYMAVGWDNWQEVGIAANTELPPHLQSWQSEILEKAIRPQEGVEIFRRLLTRSEPTWILTTQDLPGRIQESRYYTGERILQEFGGGGDEATASAVAELSSGQVESRVAEIWQRVLGVDRVRLHDNFFDLGGNSLVGMQLMNELNRELGVQVAPVTLFESPTVAALAETIRPRDEESEGAAAQQQGSRGDAEAGAAQPTGSGEVASAPVGAGSVDPQEDAIAIIGLSGRFPGASSADQLWDNLISGVESTTFFSEEELLAAGVARSELDSATYVKARPILDDVAGFDAELFGYAPREAEVMDPQHRLFLEVARESLETAGHDPRQFSGEVGVFAGCAISTYLLNLYSRPELVESVGSFQTMVGNEKDSLPTRVSYKLDLRGPSVAVQTFCSTSLVAVHMACRSLQSGECEMAIAGGASVHLPQQSGYHYQDGGFVSADGRVKAFDSSADGFIFGNGVGAVVLRRLSDALRDGDPIRAVIRGSAVNNDGSHKVGYSATSVEGQAEVIARALEHSGVDADSIQYIETHGTGTRLGDPVEMAALTKAFRRFTDRVGDCPIGSVKTNIGHLDRAAGVTGLIKATLALENRQIPASLHFQQPNPQIDFAASPFFVNDRLRPWPQPQEDTPRRAGINSLGLGGTNAHVVLEQAPRLRSSGEALPVQLLPLSAQTPWSLDRMSEELGEHLETLDGGSAPDRTLADVAHTLCRGRQALRQRRFIVAGSLEEAARRLTSQPVEGAENGLLDESARPSVIFLFPGLGGQYIDMARGLYDQVPAFRQQLDRAAEALQQSLGEDLRELIFAGDGRRDEAESGSAGVDLKAMLGRSEAPESAAEARLRRTENLQPALFAIELALAKTLIAWGVEPQAMLGYSLGEYVAATLAGVFDAEDALRLIALRARLIAELEEGEMLAVPQTEVEVRELLEDPRWRDDLSLAAVNGPQQSVVAGSPSAVAALEQHLQGQEIACRRLETSHAFHSHHMDPVAEALGEALADLDLQAPRWPLLSNVTGRWLRSEEATDPEYWRLHLTRPVRFSDALVTLLESEERPLLLEVGPGRTLSSLVLQHPAAANLPPTAVLATLPHAYQRQDDLRYLLTTLGRLWLAGAGPDWETFFAGQERLRLRLPTYAYQRQRFFVEARSQGYDSLSRQALGDDGGSAPEPLSYLAWRRAAAVPRIRGGQGLVAVAADAGGLGDALLAELEGAGVPTVRLNAAADDQDWSAALPAETVRVVDLRSLDHPTQSGADSVEQAFDALVLRGAALGSALATLAPPDTGTLDTEAPPRRLWVVTNGACEVGGQEQLRPAAAMAAAVARVLPRELSGLQASWLDLDFRGNGDTVPTARRLAREILAEEESLSPLVALRGRHRWVPTQEPVQQSAGDADPQIGEEVPAASASTVDVVIGGLNDRGFLFARHLARRSGAQLLLLEPPAVLEGEGAARRRERLQLLEAKAAVRLETVDLSDADALAAALAQARSSWGPPRRVLHCAEPASGDWYRLAAEAGGEDERALLRLKVESVEALDEALSRQPEETAAAEVLLVTSCASLIGGLGLLTDAAAGLWLEAYGARRSAEGAPWSVINWDYWEDPSGAVRSAAVGSSEESSAQAAEGALDDLFSGAPEPRWVATPRRLERDWAAIAAALGEDEAAQDEAYYPRPELQTSYLPPQTETELTIAEIWQSMLGVQQVGVNDDFLELGGDSLLATRMVARMRDAFGVDLPVRTFFEASTVATLARAVEELVAATEAAESDDMDELLQLLDSMSEEEVEAELARRQEEVAK
ncbi:MAG: SDR family NAD(P)-dependent oxidoreductase [Acidobacteriota bacterium]